MRYHTALDRQLSKCIGELLQMSGMQPQLSRRKLRNKLKAGRADGHVKQTLILLTGGVGYISRHTYLLLLEAGFQPIILGDFCNSKPAVLERL